MEEDRSRREGGFLKGLEGERKSNGLDYRFWFGVLFEVDGFLLEWEIERWFGEGGGNRKIVKVEE